MQDNIFLSSHFCLKEFTESATARKHGIVNEAPPEAVENLRRLCQGCLEPLREALQLPVVITSGYRTKELNSMLAHASDRSQHIAGQAADLYVAPGRVSGSKFQVSGEGHRARLIKAFRLIITGSTGSPTERWIDFDQLILYPNFIHVSFVSKEKNRRGILLARSDGKLGYGRITLSNALKIN